MNFTDAVNELMTRMSGSNWFIKGIVTSPDLSGCKKRETEMSLFPVEFVNQRSWGDDCFYGDIYFPLTGDDGAEKYLHVVFNN